VETELVDAVHEGTNWRDKPKNLMQPFSDTNLLVRIRNKQDNNSSKEDNLKSKLDPDI
jgi:hypothetical protein